MKKIMLVSLSCFLLSGCIKEEINLQKVNSDSFDPSFAIPIGNVKLQLGRINDRSDRFLEVNSSTGLLELIFKNRTFDLGFNDFFIVPNQSLSTSTSMNASQVSAFNTTGLGSTYNFSSSNVASISVPSAELLDSILVNNGNLNITVSSTYAHDISIVLTIPSLVKNGIPYSTTIPLNYVATIPVTNTANLSLAGYTIDLTDGGVTDNTIRFNYNTTLTKGVSSATTAEAISFTSNYTLTQIDEVHGYFGNRTINRQDTISYDLYGNILGGTISFAEPRIELAIYNSTGISFDADFTSISAPDNTINQNMGGPGLTSIPIISKSLTIGDSTLTNHIIDNSNTVPTLSTMLDEKPKRFAYGSSVQFNPGGLTNNFITRDSRLWASTKFVLPLNGWGSGFSLTDTNKTSIENSIGLDSVEAENIKKLTLRIITTNRLPVSATIQAYFLDSTNLVLDSLFISGASPIIGAGTVNFSVPTTDPNYGRVISPSTRTIDVEMTKDQYQKLVGKNQTKIVYKVNSNTIGSSTMKNVKIFPEDYVNVKLSAKLDLTISIK